MESSFSALTATTTTSATARALRLFTISKALNCRFSAKSPSLLARPDLPSQLVARQVRCLYTNCLSRPNSSVHPFLPSSSLRGLFAAVPEVRRRLERISNSTKSFGTAAGGGGGGLDGVRGGGGGGGDGCGGGDSNSELISGAGQEGSTLLPDVIILDVGGMTCGGCAASVKRILESQPQVSSASVNLTTETAIVWPVSEAKVVPNWQQQLGEALAQHLSTCGFKSNLRVAGEGAIEEGGSP